MTAKNLKELRKKGEYSKGYDSALDDIEEMLRDDVFYSFADQMRKVFDKAGEQPGNFKEPWKEFSMNHLRQGFEEEVKELIDALEFYMEYKGSNDDRANGEWLQKECKDVSNFCLFIDEKIKSILGDDE